MARAQPGKMRFEQGPEGGKGPSGRQRGSGCGKTAKEMCRNSWCLFGGGDTGNHCNPEETVLLDRNLEGSPDLSERWD